MRETQHQIIIDRCSDGQWHCGNEWREWFIFSPHKRRIEIEGRKNRQQPITGKYRFLERKCEHGSVGVKDYLMVENEENTQKVNQRDGRRPILPEMLHNRPIQERSKDRMASQLNLWRTTG